jgi:hypothetical protein
MFSLNFRRNNENTIEWKLVTKNFFYGGGKAYLEARKVH